VFSHEKQRFRNAEPDNERMRLPVSSRLVNVTSILTKVRNVHWAVRTALFTKKFVARVFCLTSNHSGYTIPLVLVKTSGIV